MSKTFASMGGRVSLHVPGIPSPLIVHSLREAAIDLCRRSKCWREDLSATVLTAGFPYTAVPTTGAVTVPRVSKVLRVIADGLKPPLDEIDEREASLRFDDWKATTGTLDAFTENPVGVIRLVPLPATTVDLEITVALEPDETATGIDDFVYNEHRETIISGAVYRLAMIPGKPWTNFDVALIHKKIFEDGVDDAAVPFNLNFVMPSRHVAISPL